MMQKKIIFALGNKESEGDFTNTRHNLGFIVLDKILSILLSQKKLTKNIKNKTLISYTTYNNELFFIKQNGFINNSGKYIKKLAEDLDIRTKDIIVIHDDVNMETGKVRFRMSGSSGGHNGIKDIINELKSENFCRIKVGIGKGEEGNLKTWVLGKFDKEERNKIEANTERILEIIMNWIEGRV